MSKFKIGDLVKGIKYLDDIVNKNLLKAEILGYMGTFSSLTKLKIIEHNDEKYIGQTMYYIDEKLLDYYSYPDDSNNKRKPRNGYRPVTVKRCEYDREEEIKGYLMGFGQQGSIDHQLYTLAIVELEDGKVEMYIANQIKFDDV